MTYQIKPLLWTHSTECGCCRAETVLGVYSIYDNHTLTWIPTNTFPFLFEQWVSVEAAKIRAWEHWCSLIKQCLVEVK